MNALEEAFRDWQFWAVVIGGILAWGQLNWKVARHDKMLNGPLDVLKTTVINVDKKVDILVVRQDNRDKEVENIRTDIKAVKEDVAGERKAREEAVRRIYQKIDTGRVVADSD